MNLQPILNDVYTKFAASVIGMVGTDSKELITTAAGYVADSKAVFLAIGAAALAANNPMPWSEVKLKLVREGEICLAAFKSLEQLIASDIQAFVNTIISTFENLLTGALLSLQSTSDTTTTIA